MAISEHFIHHRSPDDFHLCQGQNYCFLGLQSPKTYIARATDFQGQDGIYLKLSLSLSYLHPSRHISFLSKSNCHEISLYLQPESASCHPLLPRSYMIQALEPQSPNLLPLHINIFPRVVLSCSSSQFPGPCPSEQNPKLRSLCLCVWVVL